MVIQPIYNILFLPDVTYHFKKEFFTENASEQLEVGSELLFAFLRPYLSGRHFRQSRGFRRR